MFYDREVLRTDATVEMQIALDTQIRENFPLLTNARQLKSFTEGVIPFASFPIQATTFFAQVCQSALERASNKDDPAFCKHGSEHATFYSAISSLIEDMQKGKVAARKQPCHFLVETTLRQEKVQVERLVLEGKERIKTTFRPGPHQLANEIKNEYPDPEQLRIRNRILQKAAALYGVPFAILSAIYLGLAPTQIIPIFEDKNVRGNIITARERAGIRNAKLPHKSDLLAFAQLYRAIAEGILMRSSSGLIPRPSADAYINALSFLPCTFKRDTSDELTQFVEIKDIVIPRAVFAGLDEKAQKIALRDFKEPYRSMYISRVFGDKATTELITAFLETKVHSAAYRYSHLLKS